MLQKADFDADTGRRSIAIPDRLFATTDRFLCCRKQTLMRTQADVCAVENRLWCWHRQTFYAAESRLWCGHRPTFVLRKQTLLQTQTNYVLRTAYLMCTHTNFWGHTEAKCFYSHTNTYGIGAKGILSHGASAEWKINAIGPKILYSSNP